MTSDCNLVLQPDGTYRYLRNCSLISQDGNNYVIKDCLGNVRLFTINLPYLSDENSTGKIPMPIGFISFPDKLIVFSTSNQTESGVAAASGEISEIGIIKYLPYGEGIKPNAEAGQLNSGYTPLYNHTSLGFTQTHRIEGFSYPETDQIQRVYWSDNLNQPYVLDTGDPVYTTYFATGTLIVGTQYMVVEGVVSHNAVRYGPGLPTGNVFTAVNANYTDRTPPVTKVISYVPFQLLYWTPSRMLGGIQFQEYGTGSVFCGSKVYFYRLSLSNGSYTTPWSYPSAPIHVGTANIAGYIGGINYDNFVGGGTPTFPLNSNLSVKVKIDNLDTNFGVVELACAEYDTDNTVPRAITIVAKGNITSSSITLEHTGLINTGNLTLSDLTLFPANLLKVKTLTTNKLYNLIGNITQRSEFTIDLSGVTVSSFQYPMNCFYDVEACTNLVLYNDTTVSPVCGVNPGAGAIAPWSRWLVTNIAGGNVTYNAVSYTLGQVFVGVAGTTSATIPGGSQVRPCVTRNRYNIFGGAVRVENAIEIKGSQGVGFWDYKEPTVDQHCTSYWSRETYRPGILFYDLKGNPFFVKPLPDFTFPSINSKSPRSGVIIKDAYSGKNMYSLNTSGMVINGLVIPQAIMDQISGFSIVRAERVPRIITQGLVTQCVSAAGVGQPGAYIPVGTSNNAVTQRIYTYLCPDSLINSPLKTSIGSIGDILEDAGWVDAYAYPNSAGGVGAGAVKSGYNAALGNQDIISSKIIEPLTGDSAARTGKIVYFDYYNEGDSKANFPAGAAVNSFNNNMSLSAGGTIHTNMDCLGGTSNLQGFQSIGGKKIVVVLDADFNHYSSVNGYGSVAANAQTQKILMNYVKANVSGNLYGDPSQTLYISTGHFQPITTQVKSDTANGAGGYTFNNIEVFGGDCRICLIDHGYGLWNNAYGSTYSYAWTFPCECNSNYNLRRGRKPSNVGMYYTGKAETTEIVWQSPTPVTRLEDYFYNPGYSTEGQSIRYPGLPLNFRNSSQFKNRIRFGGVKLTGEIIDSFRTFLTNDFHDVDVQGGEINKLAIKDGHVIVWQNKMMATVPILERQVISGTPGSATSLGTGGVVDRHDPINSFFGTQHQWSVTETEFGYMWFDMRRKALVSLDTNIWEVSSAIGLEGFFNEQFLEAVGDNLSSSLFVNSPNWDATSDRPLVGTGITGVYDPKFKITYMIFKFIKQVYNQSTASWSYINMDFSVMYYHPRKMIIGFSDFTPGIAHNHNQMVISANNPKNKTKYYGTNMISTAFVVGDVVADLNGFNYGPGRSEYICINPVTITSYPGTAGAGGTNPTTGTNNWTKINSVNELWVNNQPNYTIGIPVAPDYVYNKLFGQVLTNELWIVINPKTRNPFSALSYEQITPTNTYDTDVIITAGSQTAQDNAIQAWDTHYKYIYDRICASYPLSANGRVTNNYLLVKFQKKNWLTDPTVIATNVKILQAVLTKFVEKR